MKCKTCDVLGIGTPIVDQVIKTTHEFIASLPGKARGSHPVDYYTFLSILEKAKATPMTVSGGSAANTIKGLAMLGKSCRMFGKMGDDAAGAAFAESMRNAGVETHLLVTKHPTAQVACLVTPDNERTMRSFLGAGEHLEPDDLTPELFEGVTLVHIEGYLADRPELLKKAMHLAKNAKAKVSFDLSSHEMVLKHKKQMVDLMAKNVDILFANVDETKQITGLDPEKGCLLLRDVCPTAVVKMGPGGCWVANEDGCYHQVAIIPEQVMDTTGAGDLFASGFLYGYLEDADIRKCAHFGALVATKTISVFGTGLTEEMWASLREKWKSL